MAVTTRLTEADLAAISRYPLSLQQAALALWGENGVTTPRRTARPSSDQLPRKAA